MTKSFRKYLLSELRMAVYQPGDPAELTDELLCEAVTLNENLTSLGYILRPEDLLRLAVSPSLRGFYTGLKTLVPDVTVQPMYPGFPQQVMAMSEAEFRLHQMLHYFSTYGLEDLLGTKVQRGWLPNCDGSERTESDTRLLESRVIELVSERDAAFTALRTLLNRRERLTNPELELVLESAAACPVEQMQGLKVRFKENIDLLFPLLMEKAERETALPILRTICQHTGDMLRCAETYIRTRRYHLRTSEKKLLVKLLESYSVWNLRENLMKSQRHRERNLWVLQHLDYNRFSRSAEHRETVRALRNGELLSWHGVGEALLRARDPGALTYLAKRPGYMLRMLNRLLYLDYSEEAVSEAMLLAAGAVSTHLILKTIRSMADKESRLKRKYSEDMQKCEADARLCRERLEARYLRWPQEQARREAVLMFAETRADIRLLQDELITLRQTLSEYDSVDESGELRLLRNANTGYHSATLMAYFFSDYFQEERSSLPNRIAEKESELAALYERLDAEKKVADLWLEKRLKALEEDYLSVCAEKLHEVEVWEQQELARLALVYQPVIDMYRYNSAVVRILKRMLREHFRKADTPLKGKKVFCRLEQFDLGHSTLETEDRSKDGGYIRSGIAYRIPEDAKTVRFFVYWNDSVRVDVDLHAGGVTTDGKGLHVGWNAAFKNSGVVRSGDITHSDAAEYIDIDLSAPVKEIYANVHLFSGRPNFRSVETCYVGLMAVDKLGQTVKHYDPANCFFTHELTQRVRALYYGYIDVQNRFVRFVGQPDQNGWDAKPELEEELFSLQDYLDCVFVGQEVQLVKREDQADLVLTMGKSLLDNGVSLVDNNFFLEC